MNKKILTVLIILIGLGTIYFSAKENENTKKPLTITVDGILREMTLDDKIDGAELIVIGEVKTVLPSKWASLQPVPKNLTLREIFELDLRIFTDVLISPKHILKGDPKESIMRVRSFNGQIDQIRFISPDEPNYEKGKIYLLFLHKDNGRTQIVDPGDWIPINSIDGIYQVIDEKAISRSEEWMLSDLVTYIEESPLSASTVSIPDSPEVKEIMKTVEDAYDIETEAAYDFKTKKFSSVFINDSRYELDSQKLDFVRNFINDSSLETAGYLDYQLAYYNWWHENVTLFESAKKKAKLENREVTQKEIKSIIDSEWAKKWGLAPARGKSPIRENTLRFISVDIDGETATVYLHDGFRVVTLYLIRIDKKWYIAGRKGISIYP